MHATHQSVQRANLQLSLVLVCPRRRAHLEQSHHLGRQRLHAKRQVSLINIHRTISSYGSSALARQKTGEPMYRDLYMYLGIVSSFDRETMSNFQGTSSVKQFLQQSLFCHPPFLFSNCRLEILIWQSLFEFVFLLM